MRVQLIHPPAFLNPSALTSLRPSLPLGMAYIAAAIRNAGYELDVIDAVGEAPERVIRDGEVARLGLTLQEIIARVHPETEVVGISSMFTYSWKVVEETIYALRRARPDVLIIGGGEHFTGLPDESLRDSPIDILIMGEGEETIVTLLKRYQEFRARQPADRPAAEGVEEWAAGLAGTVYRKDAQPFHEPRRNRVRNVDEIAWPAWEYFDVQGYDENRLVNGIKFGRTMPILATRGCPYQCNYCSSPNMWTTKWVARNPVDVADEIESYVKKFGANNFPFHDLTAIIKKDWIVDFAREMIKRDLKINWQLPSGTRCEVVDEEVSELLAKSGGRSLNFAPESGSAAVRKKIRKQMKESSLFDAVKAARKYDLNISAFFVLGFPGDTVDDLRETARWCARLAKAGIDDVAVGFYFPIPGTTFYKEMMQGGEVDLSDDVLLAPIFVHDSFLKEKRNFSNSLSARTLTYWRYRAVWAFYSRALLLSPRRTMKTLMNFVHGREESKFDSFLQILKERFFPRRSKKTKTETPKSEPQQRTKPPKSKPREPQITS